MLTKQPLRYVLADDPGAGKTIMAGLLIRELIMRADAKKILISKEAIYAQSASWGVEESTGFIKLLGQSTATWTDINK